MYETFYEKFLPYFGKKSLQLHYMDSDSFVLSVNIKYINKNLKTVENLFDFSILRENSEIFFNKNTKVIG